ncbi:uncharacterized protein LOC116001533 [Ipomoea triloba]|uniref:uncharacterized protein LOC116001533 n=1 Tax=Ipomoea triloba TaxID=35885 RepID=UPI00125E85E5|nr:uncharacterized protein LOC116001533 [Ipomoea triloba]
MAAHELVCSGVRRRIGDGKATLIWGHPWFPNDPNPMVQTIMPEALNGALVSGLIDPATATWDLSILQDIFIPADIERILKVPITPYYDYSWFWFGDPGGCYTVKDGYRRIIGNFEPQPGTFEKWLHLWKIKCPAKWRIFLWRALSNVLPTTTNLILKRVEIDPTCPMCGNLHEDIMHSLLLCDFSKSVWHESTLHVPNMIGSDFGEWFGNVLSMLTADQLFLAVAVLYHIWRTRNRAVWEGCLPRPISVWRAAHSAAAAWRSTHAQVDHRQPQSPTLTVHDDAVLRCYFDAGFQAHSAKATVGAVLLTHGGEFVAAFNGQLPYCLSPLMAETLACKEVLSWLRGRGLSAVHIYTDCSTLKKLLTSAQTSLFSYVGFAIDATRAILSTFHICSFNLVPRSNNRGAHSLAALAYTQVSSLYWDTIPPDSISDLI